MYKIPVYQPSLSGNEKKYVNECLDTGWISGKGKFVGEFEEKFADYVGVRHAASVCNGTVALHLAIVALGIGKGDEVIVPTLTYIAPVNAIVYTGAIPVFVDSLESTWQINPEEIERKITPRTKAILPVHLYGHPADMNKICDIANRHKLFVIEDCAEAFGSLYEGKHVGVFGDIATFSFYGNKTITTGEGGMVVTNDETLYNRATHFKGQGLAKYREYWHDVVGYNYRMTNICAAVGLAQLERADELIEKKIQIADWYNQYLADSPFVRHNTVGNVRHSYWMYSVLVPEVQQRDGIREYLKQDSIETRPTFYPVHTMPMYSGKYEKHPVAENIGWRGINLPSWPDLTEDQVRYVCNILKEAIRKS
jgi:perosamine synthetase